MVLKRLLGSQRKREKPNLMAVDLTPTLRADAPRCQLRRQLQELVASSSSPTKSTRKLVKMQHALAGKAPFWTLQMQPQSIYLLASAVMVGTTWKIARGW